MIYIFIGSSFVSGSLDVQVSPALSYDSPAAAITDIIGVQISQFCLSGASWLMSNSFDYAIVILHSVTGHSLLSLRLSQTEQLTCTYILTYSHTQCR